MRPRQSNTLLEANEAQSAINAKLFSGELRAWRKPGRLSPVVSVSPQTQSIYRHAKPSGDAHWLAWLEDVDVVPSPIYNLNEFPIYLTGFGNKPKKTNAVLQDTATYRDLGIPVPITALTVAVAGGSGSPQTRVYLYTYISTFGSIAEESAGSPISNTVTVLTGSTVTITGIPAAPAGALNITAIRIYRQVTGTASNPYLKVADVAPGAASFVDAVVADSLGQIYKSAAYYPPPDDLKGITHIANGIYAGFRGNEVYFCEPYLLHAWPPQYALSVQFPIVGIAAFGNSLVVGTTGNPFVITGTNPASMTQTRLPLLEPCAAKRSMVSDEYGVMYASPNGIIKVAQGFAGNISKPLLTRDEWAVYKPETMTGAVLDNSYYLFIKDNTVDTIKGLVFNRDEQANAFTVTTLEAGAVFVEPTSASLYVAYLGEIKRWHADSINFLPFQWRSKVFVLPQPVNFGAAQIDADFTATVNQSEYLANEAKRQANAAIFTSGKSLQSKLNDMPLNDKAMNSSLMQSLTQVDAADTRFLLLEAWCNGRQVFSQFIRNKHSFRLPSGFKGDRWEFQLSGNIPTRTLKVAGTAKELAAL